MNLRVPIVRVETDGTVTDGTAAAEALDDGGMRYGDFCDLDGHPLSLPPGASFQFQLLGEDE